MWTVHAITIPRFFSHRVTITNDEYMNYIHDFLYLCMCEYTYIKYVCKYICIIIKVLDWDFDFDVVSFCVINKCFFFQII